MLQMLAVVELEVLDVMKLELVDVVGLERLVVCVDVVDGVLVALAEWVMAVVPYGGKAKDTASCGRLSRNRSICFRMAAARRGGEDSS